MLLFFYPTLILHHSFYSPIIDWNFCLYTCMFVCAHIQDALGLVFHRLLITYYGLVFLLPPPSLIGFRLPAHFYICPPPKLFSLTYHLFLCGHTVEGNKAKTNIATFPRWASWSSSTKQQTNTSSHKSPSPFFWSTLLARRQASRL